MGLQERRWVKQIQDEVIPSFNKDVQEVSGTTPELIIDWASFADAASLENVEHQCLGRIKDAIRRTCRDELGKEAVRESLHKIDIKNVEPAQKKLELVDKTLFVHASWGVPADYYTDDAIYHALESSL
jgi:hypothetical protein